jgi:hypothetical protein
VVLTQVVTKAVPFQFTTELASTLTKFMPFTVRVNPPLPTRTFVGEIEVSVSSGNRQVPKH